MGKKKKHLGEKGRIKIYSKSLAFIKTDNCLRCGGSHTDLPLYEVIGKPILEQFNCYTICPITKEPILVEFTKKNRRQKND